MYVALLDVNKLSKSILIKKAKDKMSCHFAQLSKGFNVTIHIGFTPTDKQTDATPASGGMVMKAS